MHAGKSPMKLLLSTSFSLPFSMLLSNLELLRIGTDIISRYVVQRRRLDNNCRYSPYLFNRNLDCYTLHWWTICEFQRNQLDNSYQNIDFEQNESSPSDPTRQLVYVTTHFSESVEAPQIIIKNNPSLQAGPSLLIFVVTDPSLDLSITSRRQQRS